MDSQLATLPVIPFKDTILLPGTILRIPIRTDVAGILSKVYGQVDEKETVHQPKNDLVACVPLNSPLLSQNGQKMIPQDDKSQSLKEQPDIELSRAKKEDLFGYGVAGRITAVEGTDTGSGYITLAGITRIRLEKIVREKPFLEAEVSYLYDDISPEDVSLRRLFFRLKEVSQELVTILRLSSLLRHGSGPLGISPLLARRLELYITKKQIQGADALLLADFMVNIAEASYEERLMFLATTDIENRLNRAIDLLQRQVEKMKRNVSFTITSTTLPRRMDVDQMPTKRTNRPGLPRNIPGMPGMGNPQDEADEMEELKSKLDAAKLPPEAAKIAERELKRLKKMPPVQAEYQVIRNYLETLAELPWSKTTEDRFASETLARARKQLDDDHYGQVKVKKRLLEYLAVLKLKQSINNDLNTDIAKAEEEKAAEKAEILKSKRMVDKSPILLLLGPPGVGKTSLAKSIATSLQRPYHRLSLGGIRDEAEIRGHRKTYVGAMPGALINGLKKVGVSNPIFLLDELDKLSSSNFHGDPSAAMLEVLDPAQNHSFTDHYINIPFDLSKVLFIATANSLDTIPPPLIDRLEILHLSGYTALEKKHIALQHLIPKQIRTNGLGDGQVEFNQDVVSKIIESYTRESGVRQLEREMGSVCRAKAVQFAEAKDAGHIDQYRPQVTVENVEDILGIEKYEEEIAEKTSLPGVVTGLVAYSTGGHGSIMFIEVSYMPGNGKVQLTGKLGDVLKESVEVALSWVRSHAFELGLTQEVGHDIMKNRNIHVHCPAGSIGKDGPSAGMAHTMALISLFSQKPIPPTIAMTGEISLRGLVTGVGGIKEKMIGALRAGVKTVLLPAQNRKDVKDLPQEVKDGLEIVHVRHIWEAIKFVWSEAHFPGEQQLAGIESQL